MTAGGTEYVLPGGTRRAAIARRLGADPDGTADARRTYYDTFDGRLHARGLTLALEDGRLELGAAAGGPPGPAADVGAERPRFLPEDLPEGPLRDALAPLLELRALIPTASVRVRSERLLVRDDEGKTVVRLAAESAATRAGGRARPLARRLALAGVRGYERELALVRRAVEEDLGLVRAERTLADEAVLAAGGRPAGVSSKLAIELERSEPAGPAAARVLAQLQAIAEANVPGTLADLDTEFLHDLRVAVRRTRSVQRQLAPVFPARRLPRFRAEFRWLQLATGPTRDLDVELLEFDELAVRVRGHDEGALEPLRAAIAARRAREFELMKGALTSARTRRLLRDWSGLIDGLAAGTGARGEAAYAPIGELAAARILRVHRKLVRMGSVIDDDSPAESLHDLRKKGKELRYLLEIFGGMFPADTVKPLVKSLKRLQDTLGRHQDRAVQIELLHELRDEVAGQRGGAAALMAMGGLAEELVVDQAAARSEFAGRFADFAAKEQRRAVKEVFG